MKTVGILLSGCGVYDGSEIHEAVLTALAVDRQGAKAHFIAPDREQTEVVNHLDGSKEPRGRNILREAARIARGAITALDRLDAAAIDALILPGGYGAAKNLSDFAFRGADCQVDGAVARLVLEIHRAGKPVCAFCIAPAVLSKIFGAAGLPVRLTIGQDKETAAAVERMGCRHVPCPADECVVDEENRVVSAPAYMATESIAEAAEGISKAVEQTLRLAGMSVG